MVVTYGPNRRNRSNQPLRAASRYASELKINAMVNCQPMRRAILPIAILPGGLTALLLSGGLGVRPPRHFVSPLLIGAALVSCAGVAILFWREERRLNTRIDMEWDQLYFRFSRQRNPGQPVPSVKLARMLVDNDQLEKNSQPERSSTVVRSIRKAKLARLRWPIRRRSA
jgi:hypothetical protein